MGFNHELVQTILEIIECEITTKERKKTNDGSHYHQWKSINRAKANQNSPKRIREESEREDATNQRNEAHHWQVRCSRRCIHPAGAFPMDPFSSLCSCTWRKCTEILEPARSTSSSTFSTRLYPTRTDACNFHSLVSCIQVRIACRSGSATPRRVHSAVICRFSGCGVAETDWMSIYRRWMGRDGLCNP